MPALNETEVSVPTYDCIIQLLEQIYLKHGYTCNCRVQLVNERSRPMAVVIVRTLRMTYDRFKLDERAVHHGAAVGPKVFMKATMLDTDRSYPQKHLSILAELT